jgi:hypothetical protein
MYLPILHLVSVTLKGRNYDSHTREEENDLRSNFKIRKTRLPA